MKLLLEQSIGDWGGGGAEGGGHFTLVVSLCTKGMDSYPVGKKKNEPDSSVLFYNCMHNNMCINRIMETNQFYYRITKQFQLQMLTKLLTKPKQLVFVANSSNY